VKHIRAKAALKFGSEVWVLKKRNKKRFEAAQKKFLRHLLGIIKLDKVKNQSIRKRTVAQNTVKYKTVPAKEATTRKGDGHK
jgi:hypothetical protein